MKESMKLSTKVYLGFAATILICLMLGLYGIWNFNKIKDETSILAYEYVPEIDILNRLERATAEAMYNMRGYGYTGNEKFLKDAEVNLDNVDKFTSEAVILAPKAPHLLKLKEALDDIQASVKQYRQLVEETKKVNLSKAQLRDDLNQAAQKYMENANKVMAAEKKTIEAELRHSTTGPALHDSYSKYSMLGEIMLLITSIRVEVWRSQTLRDAKQIRTALDNMNVLETKLRDFQNMNHSESSRALIETMVKSSSQYKDTLTQFIAAWELSDQIDKNRYEAGDKTLDTVAATSSGGIQGAIGIANETGDIVKSSVVLFSIGLVLSILIAGVLAYFISSGIARALRSIIEKLKDSSHQVSESSLQLAAASQELSGAANEQASSIEETSSSLEEIGGMIENNVDNAEQAFKLANEVMQVSESANESMRKLEKSIQEILQSNEKIERLVKVIGNIGEKTKVMDEIVFQTKLLSFNASVEAERAGEHGRGFAVVAQEVGNLAQMSGKSAQEIAEIVKTSIHEAEAITAENKKKVDQGNNYVQESAKSLKQIMDAATTVSSGSNQVLQASKDQASGIKQVNLAMTQLDKATQQNAATAEETAASSEELSAQAEVLTNIVSDLFALVEGRRESEADSEHKTPSSKTSAKVVSLEKHKKQNQAASKPAAMKKAVGAGNNTQNSSSSSASQDADDAWEDL